MPYITASGLGYNLPDNTNLFSNLNFSFNKSRIAIVGKNGVGKTTLFDLITKRLKPSLGSISVNANWELLPQNLDIYNNFDVLDILGVKAIYTAYRSIISGNYKESDYDILNNRWDIESEIEQSLSRSGFNNINYTRSFSSFSGGERVRLFLSRILINNPDFFLMDEPTNNLDSVTKQYIYNFISSWNKGFVVISHDRTLLDIMDDIYELTPKKLTHYSGNYTFYKTQKKLEIDKLNSDIVTAKKELRKVKKSSEETLHKNVKRAKRGEKNRSSIPKIVANAWKNSSEQSQGSIKLNADKRIKNAETNYNNLLDKTESQLKIRVDIKGDIKHRDKVLVNAENINFRYSSELLWDKNISFLIEGRDKILITGINGSGKSTLCKLITGELLPCMGELSVNVKNITILDQNISCINNNLTLLENIRLFSKPDIPEHNLRIILGGFLFYGDDVFKKARVLSGGEKMRLALACLFSTDSASELLILDEPTNNMDLESIEQLTKSIKQYPGAIVLISHDEYFINDIGIEKRIEL